MYDNIPDWLAIPLIFTFWIITIYKVWIEPNV